LSYHDITRTSVRSITFGLVRDGDCRDRRASRPSYLR